MLYLLQYNDLFDPSRTSQDLSYSPFDGNPRLRFICTNLEEGAASLFAYYAELLMLCFVVAVEQSPTPTRAVEL
jgi:hypothetical protein